MKVFIGEIPKFKEVVDTSKGDPGLASKLEFVWDLAVQSILNQCREVDIDAIKTSSWETMVDHPDIRSMQLSINEFKNICTIFLSQIQQEVKDGKDLH